MLIALPLKSAAAAARANERLDAKGLGLGAKLEVLAGEDDDRAGELPAGLGKGYRDGSCHRSPLSGIGRASPTTRLGEGSGDRHSCQAGGRRQVPLQRGIAQICGAGARCAAAAQAS